MIPVAVYLASLGDAATAAAIAGGFTIVNTALGAVLLKWVYQGRREIRSTYTTAAHAATAAESAAEGALEACRVAKSIGAAIRRDDALIVHHEPEREPE